MGLTYTIAEAAQAVGVHPHTIRKRIKAGKLGAALVEGPNGPEYRIPVGVVHQLAAEAMAERGHPGRGRSTAPSDVPSADSAADSESSVGRSLSDQQDTPSTDSESRVTATTLAIARAQEMAAYTQRLLEPLQLRLAEQAEEIGRLRAELRHSQTQSADHERSAEEVGRLRAELEQARQQVAGFEAATDELEREQRAGAAEAARRPWWRFWG